MSLTNLRLQEHLREAITWVDKGFVRKEEFEVLKHKIFLENKERRNEVYDLESKLVAANLQVTTLQKQVKNAQMVIHQFKDDIEEWRSAAASRSAQVRNLEKQLRDEQEEHDEIVRKYSHKVDDLEELLNDERNEYESVLIDKCSLLGEANSLKGIVEELTEKIALLEEAQRSVVEPDEETPQPTIEIYARMLPEGYSFNESMIAGALDHYNIKRDKKHIGLRLDIVGDDTYLSTFSISQAQERDEDCCGIPLQRLKTMIEGHTNGWDRVNIYPIQKWTKRTIVKPRTKNITDIGAEEFRSILSKFA
tara:strand:+ start:1558 stop:2478 length:921 start_codon:yes stop_codon:yes gene_type:complete